MKAVVAAFNQEKALVGAFSVITNLRMELFQALVYIWPPRGSRQWRDTWRGRGEAASVQHLQVPSVAAADVGVNRGPAVE